LEKYQRISQKPCSVFLVQVDIVTEYVPSEISSALWSKLPDEYLGSLFRAVSKDRLSTVLRQGIDVEPTNAVIWVNHLDKALEYGGWPKLVMALDYKFLERTFVELDADASEAEVTAVRRDYPTISKRSDSSKLFYSRLKEDDPQLCTPYEFDSAWWIPGDPWKALKGIFLFFRPRVPADIENLRGQNLQKD
jgi:hypothetical protein